MTNNDLNTGIEATSKTLCISNIPQVVDNFEHHTDIINFVKNTSPREKRIKYGCVEKHDHCMKSSKLRSTFLPSKCVLTGILQIKIRNCYSNKLSKLDLC